MSFSNTLRKITLKDAEELFSTLVEEQQLNPSQAIEIVVSFRYCAVDEAWDIAEQYYSRPLNKGKLRSVKTL